MQGGYRKNTILGNAMLFGCALIWGMALVAQRQASNTVSAFAFNGMRFYLATAVLIITFVINELISKRRNVKPVGWNKMTILGGILSGIAIFFGNNLQQIGVSMTSVGKTGFITVLYIVIVPIIGVLARKKPNMQSCIAICIALLGFCLMSFSIDARFNVGDAVVLMGALMISYQIYFIGAHVEYCDPIKLTLVQFATAAVLSVPAMAIEGFPNVVDLNANIIPILYVGILSAGVAFTFQSIGQRHTDATTASLIMSVEAVISMMGAMIIFHETYTLTEIAGCIIVMVAVCVAQVSFKYNPMLKLNVSKYFVE